MRAAVDLAAAAQPVSVKDTVKSDVLAYVAGRLEQLVLDSGVPAEAARAVLAERGDDAALAMRTA
eukprot:366569-Chlamydomonas_euryale.AAC.48